MKNMNFIFWRFMRMNVMGFNQSLPGTGRTNGVKPVMNNSNLNHGVKPFMNNIY